MSAERLEDIVGDYDASLIADETAARDAEVVAPPGWIVVTWAPTSGERLLFRTDAITVVRPGSAGAMLQTGEDDTWSVTETPAQIAALIAAAQAAPTPARDDVAEEMAEEMADALRWMLLGHDNRSMSPQIIEMARAALAKAGA